MLDQSDVIPQYNDDVPLEDDYNIIVPEIAKLDDEMPEVKSEAELRAEMKIAKSIRGLSRP